MEDQEQRAIYGLAFRLNKTPDEIRNMPWSDFIRLLALLGIEEKERGD